MKTEPEPFDPGEADDSVDPSDLALDQLLALATWPRANASLARLQQSWRHETRRRRIIPLLWIGGAALAAAALVAIVVGIERTRLLDQPLVQPKFMAIVPDHPATQPIASRPPTAYERLIAIEMNRPPAKKPPAAPGASDVPVAPAVDPKVEQFVQQLNDPLMDRRYEAARALAQIEQPQVVGILARMVEQDVNRREAIIALMLSKDPLAATALTHARTSPDVDVQIRSLRLQIQ